MRLLLGWPNCDTCARSGIDGRAPVDAFWIEATARETQAQFMPFLTENPTFVDDQLPPKYRKRGYDYYLVARDLSFVRYMPRVFPWSSQWYDSGPFRRIVPIELDHLAEIVNCELAVYDGPHREDWLPVWMQTQHQGAEE